MKTLVKTYVLGLSVIALSGCGSSKEDVPSCCQDARPLVINVLSKEDYDDCHIAGSIHADFDDIESSVRGVRKDKDIVVYCSNYACGTSGYVAKHLQALGYTNVTVYEGGTAEWKQAGLPTVGPARSAYLQRVMQQPEKEQEGVTVITMQELADKLQIESNEYSKAA